MHNLGTRLMDYSLGLFLGSLYAADAYVVLLLHASVRASVRPSVRPKLHVSAISPVSIDGFSPNFCHWYILGQRSRNEIANSKKTC